MGVLTSALISVQVAMPVDRGLGGLGLRIVPAAAQDRLLLIRTPHRGSDNARPHSP